MPGADKARWLLELPGLRSASAGMLGGLAMRAYEMMAAWSIGPGLLAPLELIGATHPFAGMHAALVGAGMHLVTAAFWGTKSGSILRAAPREFLKPPGAVLTGLAWGIGVWIVMGKIVGPLLNPMIARAPEPHFFVGHVVYGVVSALALGVMLRRFPAHMGRESLP